MQHTGGQSMRKRDKIFAGLAWAGLLAGLVWALCTQFRWVQENKPIQVQRPALEPSASEPAPANATGVLGTVSDDTRAAMARELETRKAAGPGSGPATRSARPRKPAPPPG
jgi:hypothetical protein